MAAAACLIALGYSLYTQEIWEDSLITLRHSENLLRGEGLVYNPGERVHGFTSPVNVLLLALCHLLTGQTSYLAAFWLYRLLTIAAFAGGGVLLLRAAQLATPRWAPALWFLAAAYVFDSRSVAFSTNGMETGFMLLAVGWAIYLMVDKPGDRWLTRGCCWAALMWTRPDGCVYIAALAVAELWFFCAGRRWVALRSLVQSAACAAVLYGPWVVWAWSYYGSPIPHTVTAKSDVEFGAVAHVLSRLDILPMTITSIAARVLRPTHFSTNAIWLEPIGWTHAIAILTNVLGVFCLLYWLFPVRDPLGRAASFCFTVLCLYFSFLTVSYPWYYPPAAVFAWLTLARAAAMWADPLRASLSSRAGSWRRSIALATLSVLALAQVAIFAAASRASQVRQTEIETGNRAAIGQWLKENGHATDTVYLEPLGYIGYFSGLRMLDYPGLVSPQVVELRRENAQGDPTSAANRVALIPKLSPDWVVLRFSEYEVLRASPIFSDFHAAYRLEKVFDVNKQLDAYDFLPARQALKFDAGFGVFRRIAAPALPPTS